jgi:hypothetical protein
MKKRQRFWFVLLTFFICLVALLVYAAVPGKSTFTISNETTIVTDTDEHGYVDYVRAANERLRQGVTPENNANVLIWRAFGPHPEGGTMPPEFFDWLGIASPPEEGDYMVGFQMHITETVKTDAPIVHEKYYEMLNRAMKRPWTEKEEPDVAGWLDRNEKPLAVLIEGTRRTKYYNPLTPKKDQNWSPGLIGALLPSVQKCREAAMALTCRAMFRVGQGQFEDAWQDLLACHRLGRLVAQGGCLIELLVGLAIDQIATTSDIAYLQHSKLSSSQILAKQQELRNLPEMASPAAKLDISERFMMLESMLQAARYGPSHVARIEAARFGPVKEDASTNKLFTPSIDWDLALRNANRWIDRCVAACHIADRTERHHALWLIVQDLKLLKEQFSDGGFIMTALKGPGERGEILGNVVISLLLPAFEKVQEAWDRNAQVQRNLQIAFALSAYRQDQGHYPATLADLAPKYLPEIADDLFSGKPLIYRPAADGFLLYSVGVNGKDDDGRSPESEPRGDDLSVRVPELMPATKK